MIRALLEADARLSEKLGVAEKPGLLRNLAAFLAHSGDSWFWGFGLVLVWLLGEAGWKYRAVVLFVAIAVTAIIVQTLKWTVRRRRPPGEWGAIYRNADPHSFPSGHAARAIMLAVLGLALGPAWFALILCVWGPLVALARVAMGVHYVSDVAAGALLGVLFGLFFGGTQTWFAPYYTWLVW
ncbi:MAG: phosphatase PAP2 family protein [Anaerolineales bacterium]|nr:phosphatase PAP2 family protein [Anaerolineales bacterium]